MEKVGNSGEGDVLEYMELDFAVPFWFGKDFQDFFPLHAMGILKSTGWGMFDVIGL